MKKREFVFLGIFISMIGLFFILKNLSMTGFVISGIVTNFSYYFIPIVFFIGGILIAASGDSLQEWLEKKERQKKSPSLENALQTEEEKKEFGKRYSGKPSLIKRLFGRVHVQQVPQGNISDGNENFQQKTWELTQDIGAVYHSAYDLHFSEYTLKEIEKQIREERKIIIQSKKEIGESKAGYQTERALEKYSSAIERLNELYKKIEVNFPIQDYKKLREAEGRKNFIRTLEEIRRDIEENRVAFSKEGGKIPSSLYHLSKLRELAQLEENLPRFESLIDLYINHAKTVPIADTIRKYRVTITHGFSDLLQPKETRTGNMEVNSPALTREERKRMDLKDFLDILYKQKPMLSASSVSDEKNRRTLPWGPVGVMINQGEIFDAEIKDLVTRGVKGGARYRYGWEKTPFQDLDINNRVDLALTNFTRGSHNELVIGRDYNISGMYIWYSTLQEFKKFKENPNSFRNTGNTIYFHNLVKETAQEAIKRNLPLYQFTMDNGFEQINPQDYLEQPRPNVIATSTVNRQVTKRKTRKAA